MKHGSLFSGIGGFDLAAEWMGWENVFHCEIDPFCRQILNYYWPKAISYEDIKSTDFTIYKGRIDVLTGGFPCQPFSLSGQRKGTKDERHLWPEMLRAIREIKPKWIVGENVPGIVTWNKGLVFQQIQNDMEDSGYEILSFNIPAHSAGAEHLRERIWFIAHSTSIRGEDGNNDTLTSPENGINTKRRRKKKERTPLPNALDTTRNPFLQFESLSGKPAVFPMDDGVSFELHGITFPKWAEFTMRAAGNSVYPPLVFRLFEVIEEMNQNFNHEKRH